uniref:Lipoprotein n=1 Tax=Roseihalotalea indica TaxID=2867963 RepID=A0AA49GM27_9BACT|nr:hypothetical protein K4G66_31000 [Tunicatimonas sp. TK19036]
MKAIHFFFSLSLCLVLFSACQEEDLSKTSYRSNPITNSSKEDFINDYNSGKTIGDIRVNEHVSYRFPRFPRPLPCPVLAGCQIPVPLLAVSTPQGIIRKLSAKLYTSDGELYACSGKECNGQVEYMKQDALASLTVVNEKVKAKQLFMAMEVTYEVNGKTFSEEYFDENVPLSLDMYKEVDQVFYRFPRFPRPLPCPVLAGCQDPKPEIHVVIPQGKVLKLNAELYTDEGKLYACSGDECEGGLEQRGPEAMATLNVVNPEIETESLNLVLHVTYEIKGKIFSNEIYDEDVPIDMD